MLPQEAFRLKQNMEDEKEQADHVSKFVETHDAVKAEDTLGYIDKARAKVIDDTNRTEKLAQLSHSSPWVPQLIPHAQDATLVVPPKRPGSPFSGRPLRSKDLIPIDLIKESEGSANSSIVKYLCPVSR